MSADIFARVQGILDAIQSEKIENVTELEAFRIKYVGSKNEIKSLFGEIKNVENDRKKEFGQLLNDVKQAAEEKYEALKTTLEEASGNNSGSDIDLTSPCEPMPSGSRHPVSIVLNRIISIFERIGFTVAEEREIEDDWHNFTAMNTPEDHPARDMQDTFYLKDSTTELLRTHTSSVQARIMTAQKPPIRIIAPGRVYRNETISSRSHCQFHQVEGLYIDKGVSFADMKQTLLYFAREMYGEQTNIRLRPSFFPFTEPSAEMDVYWGLNNEDDYRITKGTGWLEILGCGMVDPNVLINCGIDPNEYSGFAFGMGIERQAMLQFKITDIRQLFENDTRFLKQFSGVI
ncbi:MAG: phenylalanine--tRNA ligase subunit alpha [Saprospiraceae bacterium]|jgi:phenylalanyl-tRNA synthetase alpha chain|nr:phenylalanine--tRNA ligase subunit alpha [Saprospiraceae bacterium]MBP6235113.1 phenylalanine--tRNA ligase subunit alpha [Saprospiraceae bacterium]MBP6568866.1 phenylalanine--tRNA ligase subunit alpha [Saprospiraceae bacterium]MBP9196512.1 phenylalanine--tRNA ligase subunit alpha [Saprospiraceae bacterium]